MRAGRLPSATVGLSMVLPDAKAWAALLGEAAISAAECTALNGITRVRLAQSGVLVLAQGDIAPCVVALWDGDVALGQPAVDASFRTERHLHGPAWLDLSAGWLGEPYSQEARALSTTKLLELPRDALFAVADRHPGLWRRLGAVLAREIRGLALNTHDLMHKDAPARLAAWLDQHCQCTDELGPNQGTVQLPMRKRDIASQLAITPETLSRLMRSFSGQGVIRVSGYTVHVLDRNQLQHIARP